MVVVDIQQEILKRVNEWRSDVQVERCEQLTSDASPRRYFRLHLNKEISPGTYTAIAMVFDSLVSPDSGAVAVKANEAVVTLTRFLQEHKFPVPELYWGDIDDTILIIEDVGDLLFIQTLLGKRATEFSLEERERLFKKAVDLIVQFQRIPAKPGFFPYERGFTKEVYLKEMAEFSDYVFNGVCSDQGERNVIQKCFTKLADELDALPKVLVHRDYHGWNLMIDARNNVRVIDFQDALMATRCYDFVPLVNDRDIDSALGMDLYKRLVAYFRDVSSLGDAFLYEYDRVLLQRDLKVAGRFRKLAKERGLVSYLAWVDGTLKRIGSTIERLCLRETGVEVYSEARDVMCRYVSQIEEGRKNFVELR